LAGVIAVLNSKCVEVRWILIKNKGDFSMAITPNDIHNKDFSTKFKGFDPEEVNDFLEEVKKELPKTGTAESSAFSVLVGFLLLAASVFLYRTKKVN